MTDLKRLRECEWYLLRVSSTYLAETRDHVNGGYFRRAEKWLSRLGLEPFVPTRTRWRLRSRYTREKDKTRQTVPLLPGYILINADLGRYPTGERRKMNWYLLEQKTKGWCFGPVLINGEAVKLAGEVRKDRRALVDSRGLPVPPQGLTYVLDNHREVADETERYMATNKVFAVGDLVEVMEDAFMNMPATVAQIDGPRTEVVAEFFGSERKMWVETEKLTRRAA